MTELFRPISQIPAQVPCCRCGCEVSPDLVFNFRFQRHARDVNPWTIRAPLCLECRQFINRWQLLAYIVPLPLVCLPFLALVSCREALSELHTKVPHAVGFIVVMSVMFSGLIFSWLYIRRLKRWGVWPVTSSGPGMLAVSPDADPTLYWRGKTDASGAPHIEIRILP